MKGKLRICSLPFIFFCISVYSKYNGYIAPEQFMPDAKAEPRTDIFSLGIVIEEIATTIGDKKLEKIAKICTTHNHLLRPSSIEILRKRLLEKPKNQNIIILLGSIVFLLAVAIGISYYHRHQVTQQKEATTEQYLEEDSANHSGNKVMDINFHTSHQNSCVLMPNDKPKTSQKPAEPLR